MKKKQGYELEQNEQRNKFQEVLLPSYINKYLTTSTYSRKRIISFDSPQPNLVLHTACGALSPSPLRTLHPIKPH